MIHKIARISGFDSIQLFHSLPKIPSNKHQKLLHKSTFRPASRCFIMKLQLSSKILVTTISTFCTSSQTRLHQKERMELDNKLFPCSAWLAFTLHTSKKFEELSDYLELQEETDVYITTVKQELKTRILKVTDMEITALRTDILKHFVQPILLCSKNPQDG